MSDRSYANAAGVMLSLSTTPTSAITTFWAANPGVVTTAPGGGHTLFGGSGDDDFVIFTPTDQVVIPATHGVYTVTDSAWDAAYTLPTGINNLTVSGGNQVASGNAQANLIMTTSGAATVSGGGGDDVFVLGTGADTVIDPQGSGSDEIYGFNPAIDHIRLDGSTQFTDWASIQSALQQVGSNAVLNMGNGQTLTFQDETVADLSSSNFYLPINTASLSLTFDDEFNSFVSSPNGSVGWMTSWPYGGINDRAFPDNGDNTYYSDSSVGVNPFKDVNGVLDLTATVAAAGSNPDNMPYISGTITTYKSEAQLYGYFEINCELPTGQGLWPSFYMESYDNSAELDIFEILGISPTTLHATATDWKTDTSTTSSLVIPNSSTGFHTYGVDWEPNTVTFYMDGNVIYVAPTPASMHVPMYMIAAMGVGAPGSWAEAPSTNSIFPATMQINYIRAYATAATQDVGGTAAIAQPIAITSATTAVTTTDTGSIKPFSGIAITDPNAALTETPANPNAMQTETATVTLSSTANGTLSDPKVATDGSTIVNGVWTMSGSSAAVAAALDGLIFTPTAHEVAAGGSVTTTVTATITDAGETASTSSTITTTGVAAPITMTPATGAVTTTDAASVNPFTGVVISDGNAAQTDTATVTLSAAANGTLSDPNAATDGSHVVGGVWTVSGSAAAVAAALDGLVFTPTAQEVAPGASVATTVTATVKDTAGASATATAAIKATAVARPITMTPATDAVGTSDDASVEPFAGLVITDGNARQTETATVTVSAAANGTLSDPNAATDGGKLVAGVWTMSGSSAAVAAALDGLVFTPTAHEVAPNASVATTLTATVKDSAGESASATAQIKTIAVATPITMTLATDVVATTDVASVNPLTGLTITDVNAGQIETAKVTSSPAANGTLSDPNAATDGSQVVDGVWTISGSSAAVAAALDGLVFTPTAHQVVPNNAIKTTVTVKIKDTAGESATVKAYIEATAVATPITVTAATHAVTSADAGSVKPFTGIVITDVNAGQTETAKVSSLAANGTLSDPNAATDGSKLVAGVWTVSGSAAAVATALDGLVFTPAAGGVTAAASVANTLTATVTDTAGESASTTATIKAPVATAPVATAPVATAADTTIVSAGSGALSADSTTPSFLQADGSSDQTFVTNIGGTADLTTITGFNLDDTIDLERTLAGAIGTPTLSNLSSYIYATTSASGTTLSVDPTGGHGTQLPFAFLSGFQTSVVQLQDAHVFTI